MYNELINKEKSIAIVGLGYVGLPLAVLFSKKYNVIGFDVNKEKIELYKKGIDATCELPKGSLKESNIKFTSNEKDLRDASFFVVAVPTPITEENDPDFIYITSATKTIGRNLTKGSIVVYESTVYPGVTEDICVPILEKESNLIYGSEFKVGYSPERINPGDKNNKLEDIIKIVSGMDNESLDIIANVYDTILNNGVYRAESIKVAEAAKVVENTQRDINIALVNELAMIFHNMGINTTQVIEAAGTKWNFAKYYPGLVGGHCISIDPYYLVYKSKKLKFDPQLMQIGRKVNESLGDFIVNNIIYMMIDKDMLIKSSNILVLGVTFKENCNDIRNSKVIPIIQKLNELGINVTVYDPMADKDSVKKEYNIDLVNDYSGNYDVVLFAVAHDEFKEFSLDNTKKLIHENSIIVDLKSILNKEIQNYEKIKYWTL
ncbi:MAG: nucleotide sugar dehydrogenase [Methanobacteriaceae archaeon]|nr:nucleotide sugar dehydrogenase [Methanobacteriaceae archaeon]